jgi:hypothetical protein
MSRNILGNVQKISYHLATDTHAWVGKHSQSLLYKDSLYKILLI